MAIALEREPHRPNQALTALGSLGWLAVAGGASLGAGAIHAAAIGVHSEHRAAVVTFTLVAAVQLAFGAIALARPGRLVLVAGALANLAAIAGFVAAKVSGIGFIEGLDAAEAPQIADSLAAGLAAVAVLAVVAQLAHLGSGLLVGSPLLVGTATLVVASLAVPGMLSAGSHSHAGGHADDAHPHGAADASGDAHAAAVVPPKPFDPDLPIDLGGVEGVTPQQQAAAENLLAVTVTRLPQFAEVTTAEAQGFVSIGDGFLGHEHYLNQANMDDDRLLDPDHPESLVYDTSVTPKRLVAAMFMLDAGDTLDDVPELGGALTQWHVHDNLCFAGARVAGLTGADGSCAAGLTKGEERPMIHVWIEPHPCGPFAALDGVAGGTIPEGEQRLCDHAHG